MALKVWLPLTQDSRNQGTSDLTFSNLSTSNTVINDSGKLGKCFKNNSATAGGFLSNTTINLGQNQSMFCWVNFTSLAPNTSNLGCGLVTQHRWQNNTGMGLTIKYISSTTGYLSVNTGNGSSRTYNTYCATTLMQANTWYHVGYTYNGSTLKLYVNGICEKTVSITDMSVPADYIAIYSWSFSSTSGSTVFGNYRLNGSLNDVRIYDHCLSQVEVKELSKGLVCHYKLNGTGTLPNLLSCTPRAYAPTTYQAYTLNLTENLVANQTYTLQFWDVNVSHTGKTAANLGLSVFWGGGSIGLVTMNGTNYFTNGHADYLKATFTITSSQASGSGATNLWLNIYNSVPSATGTLNMSIGKWKLEKGSVATPWIPATTDNLYTILGYNSNTIVDCSGNGYNGTLTGTPETIKSSARYNIVTHINSTDQYILTPSIPTTNFGNSYSISWWSKVPSFYCMQWGFIDGIRLNGIYQGNLWNTGDGSNNPIYYPGTTTKVSSPAWDTWHHFVMTGDGTSCKLYVNGELYGIAKTYKAISGTQIAINGWSTNTDYRYNNLSIGDFRLYSTCLSAEDIKELYQTAVKIDKLGKVHCYELQEG